MMKRISLALFALLLLAPLFGISHAASCLTITRTLQKGVRGQDVRYLQQYLVSQNLLSSDGATGYFGALTETAVQKWQSAHGPVSSGTPETTGFGVVGAKTRALLCAAAPAEPPLSPTTTPPVIVAPLTATVPTTASAPVQNGVGPMPQIQSFSADPSVINAYGEKVTLSWTVYQGSTCDVTTASSSVATALPGSNSTPVTPDKTTLYTLTCKGLGDGSTSTPATAQATRLVRVLYPLPTCSVSLDKGAYVIGDTIRLSWTSTDADHGTWKHAFDDTITLPWNSVDASGYYFIRANEIASQSATLTVFGAGGNASCNATITVAPPTALSKDVLSQLGAVAATLEAILEHLK